MTQALNFAPKAIEALLSYPCPGTPATAAGMRYLASKLREAQVFVLGDSGQLLDRSKPRPEVPCSLFRPPFPVVALEYTALNNDWDEGIYTGAKCPKRIALAWDWQDDLPPALTRFSPPALPPGVVIASIAFYADPGVWMPIGAAVHVAYDGDWLEARPGDLPPHTQAMVDSGRLPKQQLNAQSGLMLTPIALLPEVVAGIAMERGGSRRATFDILSADLMDEINAYTDLCLALACKNVTSRQHAAPAALNKTRIKAGKLPLTGFHVLELRDGGEMPGAGGTGDRSGPRSHLRRGHIRRLAPGRITWVSSSVVRGRGFVDKVYAL